MASPMQNPDIAKALSNKQLFSVLASQVDGSESNIEYTNIKNVSAGDTFHCDCKDSYFILNGTDQTVNILITTSYIIANGNTTTMNLISTTEITPSNPNNPDTFIYFTNVKPNPNTVSNFIPLKPNYVMQMIVGPQSQGDPCDGSMDIKINSISGPAKSMLVYYIVGALLILIIASIIFYFAHKHIESQHHV